MNYAVLFSGICILLIIVAVVFAVIYILSKNKIQITSSSDIKVEDLSSIKKHYSSEYAKNTRLYSAVYINVDLSFMENIKDNVLRFSFYRGIIDILFKNLKQLSGVRIAYIDDNDYILLTYSSENQFINICENITTDLANHIKTSGVNKNKYITLGMYSQKEIKVSFDSAVENAKNACEYAKKNKLIYNICNYDIFEKLYNNKKLEKTIINTVDHKDFTVKLYPYRKLSDDSQNIYEAHKRLMRPFDGLAIPPDIYKIISDSELDMQFEYSFFNKACEIINNLKKVGIEDKIIACSFSKKTISYFAFPQHIKLIADNYKVDFSKIAITVPEKVFNADKAAIISNLTILKNFGFKIYIDKYDSSYISYYDLQNFAIDMLIIDKEILFNKNTNTAKSAFENIVDFAKSLEISTACDGICEKGQEETAKEYGCDYVKGIVYETDEEIINTADIIKYR